MQQTEYVVVLLQVAGCQLLAARTKATTVTATPAVASTILIYYFDFCCFSTWQNAHCEASNSSLLLTPFIEPFQALHHCPCALHVAFFIFVHTAFWFYCSNYFMLCDTRVDFIFLILFLDLCFILIFIFLFFQQRSNLSIFPSIFISQLCANYDNKLLTDFGCR